MKKFLAILGFLIFMASGCSNDKTDQYYESGIAAIEQGDYDAAI